MLFHRDSEFSKAVTDARSFVDRFVQKAIHYRMALDSGKDIPADAQKLNEQQYVFLYELSKQTLDKKELTDQLLNILLAGRDTTASLLSITFFVMARRPEIWNKLREQVLTLEGRKPSFQELKNMNYLTWVLNESKSAPQTTNSSTFKNEVLTLKKKKKSSTPLPRGPDQRPHGQQRHPSACWRRCRWKIPAVRPQGTRGDVQCVHDASST